MDVDRLVTVPGARVTYSQGGHVSIDPWVQETRAFESVGLYQAGPATVATREGPRRVAAAAVGLDFFAVFREQPAWGRTFDRTDTFGIRHVVVGYDLGRHLIGTNLATPPTVRIDGLTFVVIGVMPQRFAFPANAQAWIPFGSGTEVTQGLGRAGVVGRLAQGVSIAEARRRVGTTAMERYSPGPGFESVRSLRDDASRGALPLLRMLMLICLLLLVVTCVNVWGLGLVASSARRHQTAIRMAMGATRRQLFIEIATRGAILASCAAALGGLVATFLWRTFDGAAARLAPALDLGVLDWRLGVYTAGGAFAATALLVAAEAVVVARLDVRSSTLITAVRSKGASRSRRFLIAGQIALAFILLSVAMASTELVARASRVDAGYSRTDAVSVDLPTPRARYAGSDELRDLVARIESRVAQRFGASAVGVTDTAIRPEGYQLARLALPGTDLGRRVGLGDGAVPVAVSADYFAAAGISLLAGRYLEPDDTPGTRPNVVISRAAARQLGLTPNQAVGREIVHYFTDVTSEIVGVVEDVRLLGPRNEAPAVVYRPLGHQPRVFALTVIVSGAGVTIPAVVEALHNFDPDMAVVNPVVLGESMWPYLQVPRLVQRLSLTAATMAVLLAAIATYGLLASDVSSKRRDIAIRLALGDRLHSVRWRYLRAAVAMTGAGIGLGLVALRLAWPLAESVSHEVPRPSVLSMSAAGAAMLIAALWAASRPASAAASVNPAELLRRD